MSLASFVEKARAQVGNGPHTYNSWYGVSDTTDWCAIFVSWCAGQAGILTEESIADYPSVPKTALVSTMYNWFRNNRRNLAPSGDPDSPNYPRPGDIAFINGTSTHVGIIVEVNDNEIKVVEGNTGNDEVSLYTYRDFFNGPSFELTHIGSNSVAY